MEASQDQPVTQRPASPPNPFHPRLTALYALGWLLVMLQGWGGRIDSDPTTWLYDPASTSARIVNRDLERAEAIDGEGLLDELRRKLHGTRDEILEASLDIQDDAADEVADRVDRGEETPEQLARCELRISVLLAESGRIDEALEHATTIGDPEIEDAFRAIYAPEGEAIPPGVEPLEQLAESGLEGWLLERAAVRLLERRGRHDEALALAREVEARGMRRQRRADLLSLANLLLVLVGSGLVVAMLGGRLSSGDDSPFVVPWSTGLGFAVLVRADFWNRLYFLVLASAGEALDNPTWLEPFYTWGTLLASLPMVWLVFRYLVPTHDLTPFGLRWGSLRLSSVLPIGAAALAIDLLGTTALAWGTWWLGFEGHWAEGLDETLIWGTTRELLETCVDYLVWTPLFEEWMFRGLVFFTLRSRMGRLPSALASAVFFSAIHFYSLPGFLMTFWSGFVWALAFERARSLVPGIVAHSAYNLFFVLGVVLLYR